MAEIILFEDSPSLRRIITRYLRDADHNVTAFENGAISQDAAVLQQADVLITDLSMPEIDGRQALRNIHMFCPDLPVIIMTGVERFADPVLDTAFGYLHKPFAEHELLKMIDRATVDIDNSESKNESEIESNIAKQDDALSFAAIQGMVDDTVVSEAHGLVGPTPSKSFHKRLGRFIMRLLRHRGSHLKD